MPEDTPSTPPPAHVAAAPALRTQADFGIGDEFGTAKKNLPPWRIVAIGVGIVVVAAAIAAWFQRPQTAAAGAIDDVVAVEIPDQDSTMVAINVSFQNGGAKPFWIHTIQAELDTASGVFPDDAASPADFQRYYEAFPVLKQHALDPLQREAKINPGGQIKGTIIVSFPVTADGFAKRQALKVIVQPYDQPVPLVLTK